MKPYKRGDVWWLRVRTPIGAVRRVSLETPHEATANAVAAWATDVAQRLDRHGVLAAVIEGSLTLPQAFVLGETDAAMFLREAAAEAADLPITDADLDAWGRWLVARRRSERAVADYRRQVEVLWPAPRLHSWLQPTTILSALDGLSCAEQTKARYRAAMGSLCQWLVRQGRLTVNPMPSVPGFAQAPPRDLWYSDADALRLLHALPAQQRALEGVMWACGWEWSAIANATVGDFDLTARTAFARGTKTRHRQRLTVIARPEVIPWLQDAMRGKLPSAPMWPGMRGDVTLKRHQAACKALGLPISTLHDWRHTFAVRELRAGRSLQFVAQMLGHANTVLVQSRYGRYALSDEEVRGTVSQGARESVAQNAHNTEQKVHVIG